MRRAPNWTAAAICKRDGSPTLGDVLSFAKPSSRTRRSFETAVTRLGGVPVAVGTNELQLAQGETIEDTARVVSRFAAACVIRTFDHHDVVRLASAAIPVVNSLADMHHPCQSLADALTLRQRFGSIDGLPMAYLGDGANACDSLIEVCALTGVDLRVATPPGFRARRGDCGGGPAGRRPHHADERRAGGGAGAASPGAVLGGSGRDPGRGLTSRAVRLCLPGLRRGSVDTWDSRPLTETSASGCWPHRPSAVSPWSTTARPTSSP